MPRLAEGLLALGVLHLVAGAATPAPPAWSGEVGSATATTQQWGPFISRYVNYQSNSVLTAANIGFNLIGA